MSRRSLIALFSSLALVATVGVVSVVAATQAQADSAGWITVCPPTHRAPDDPILYPRQPGAAHLHQFFGNRGVKASSTYRSMLESRTSCRTRADKAGYWVPALYEDGRLVSPRGRRADGEATRSVFYYRISNISDDYLAKHPVETFPKDFRVTAGNAKAGAPAGQPKLGKEIYWGCSDNSTEKLTAPPSCESGAISLHVGFPNCWNGKVSGTNDSRHLRYPDSGECPRRFPRVLPRLIFRIEYPVGTETGEVTLASGGSWTVHGDFWNTWKQPKLDRLVARCLRADEDCGTNP